MRASESCGSVKSRSGKVTQPASASDIMMSAARNNVEMGGASCPVYPELGTYVAWFVTE